MAGLLGACSGPPRTAEPDRPEPVDHVATAAAQGLWVGDGRVRPDASQLIDVLNRAAEQGLDPRRYRPDELRVAVAEAGTGETRLLARAERLLSGALVTYARDLREPRSGSIPFTDRAVALARPSDAEILTAAARAPSLARHLRDLARMNPIYEGLRRELAGLAPSDRADGRAALIRLNMDRARTIPADPGSRYLVVDTAGQRLWAFERGRAVRTMRVIVGKSGMETPAMAGLIRYAVTKPYWNIPPDLVRDRIAPRVLERGPDYLAEQGLEVLSGSGADAQVLAPDEVNWRAVATGEERVHVRQLPGGSNMMGRVKFMLPNRLGIYLHDTPSRGHFARRDRRLSSGCVRVEDAPWLYQWLLAGRSLSADGAAGPERRIELSRPVPVYIQYFTAFPGQHGLDLHPDRYRRDAGAMRAATIAGGTSPAPNA